MTNFLHVNSFLRRIPGQSFLWFAIAIFGASNAITRKLTEIGAQHGAGIHNPISLCNVLFVGNLCALPVMLLIYKRHLNVATLKQLSRPEWVRLTIVAILSGALVPGLIFQALSLTAVNNVVLIGRLEPPLAIALSVCFLGERINRWKIAGAIMAFVGVALTIFLQPPPPNTMGMGGLHIGTGELLTAFSAIASASSTVLSKKYLGHVPLGLYSVFRTALGTVIFFFLARLIYGNHHFMDAFSPFLWQWMVLYGTLIVVLGQSFWVKGLRASTVTSASLASSFTPLAAILASYFILGEAPTQAQVMGGSAILVGICLSQIGIRTKPSILAPKTDINALQIEQALETRMGFKGI
ncbi:MAG: DMT family transporter [Thermosynechococcaceae cyanobacterium]